MWRHLVGNLHGSPTYNVYLHFIRHITLAERVESHRMLAASSATRAGSSAHGGSSFSKCFEVENPRSWTVHDGKFFAQSIAERRPRAPTERLVLKAGVIKPLDRQAMKELGIAASAVARMGERNSQLLQDASLRGGSIWADEEVITPPPALQELGGTQISIREFRISSILGLGSFSSVHAAVWVRTGAQVALKIFFSPVTRTDAEGVARQKVPSSTTLSSDPRYRPQASFDPNDAESFVQEVRPTSAVPPLRCSARRSC